jgi:hypothetical protein
MGLLSEERPFAEAAGFWNFAIQRAEKQAATAGF